MEAEARRRPAEAAVQALGAAVAEVARRLPDVVLYVFAAVGLVLDVWLFGFAG
jgi:hypothetical protein